MNVLFVCKGNMTRSQMAEALFNHYAGDDLRAESAGIVPGTIPEEPEGWELNTVPYLKDALAVMRDIGLDIGGKRTRRVTPEMVDACDHAVVMADKETVPDFLLHSSKTMFWDIPNPGFSYEEAAQVRDEIARLVQGLVEGMRRVG